MGYRIEEIEGIGPANAAKLAKANITNTNHLLKLCCSAKGRKTIAEVTDISAKQILKWADMADLMRISGIGRQFGELLKAAGVDTVKELRTRKADNLAAKMAAVNAEKKLTRVVPNAAKIQDWIDKAKNTEPLISH